MLSGYAMTHYDHLHASGARMAIAACRFRNRLGSASSSTDPTVERISFFRED
ncbi:MAG: hypothetical protein K2M39_05810 [Muribaculaceae bacterium]|nr:hypothetical protein [Muribaculaceae bacterium]